MIRSAFLSPILWKCDYIFSWPVFLLCLSILNVDRPGEKLLIVTECDTKMQIASCAPSTIDSPQLLFPEVFLKERLRLISCLIFPKSKWCYVRSNYKLCGCVNQRSIYFHSSNRRISVVARSRSFRTLQPMNSFNRILWGTFGTPLLLQSLFIACLFPQIST